MRLKLTAKSTKKILHEYYCGPQPWKWVFLQEVDIGGTIADGILISCYGDYIKIGLEIKMSRSDFLKELKQPEKRRRTIEITNQFYFVTPEGMLNKSEIPEDCGLIEIRKHDGQGNRREIYGHAVHTVVKAPYTRATIDEGMWINFLKRAWGYNKWTFIQGEIGMWKRLYEIEKSNKDFYFKRIQRLERKLLAMKKRLDIHTEI